MQKSQPFGLAFFIGARRVSTYKGAVHPEVAAKQNKVIEEPLHEVPSLSVLLKTKDLYGFRQDSF